MDPVSLLHLQQLDEQRIERKKLIRKRWRKSLIIAKEICQVRANLLNFKVQVKSSTFLWSFSSEIKKIEFDYIKFNLEHKKIRQQQLTLKITGNRSTRFEERILETHSNDTQLTGLYTNSIYSFSQLINIHFQLWSRIFSSRILEIEKNVR